MLLPALCCSQLSVACTDQRRDPAVKEHAAASSNPGPTDAAGSLSSCVKVQWQAVIKLQTRSG